MSVYQVPVESSFIESIGYDAGSRVLTVIIMGRDGKGPCKAFHYADVPMMVFNAFIAASSKGQFYSLHVIKKFRPTTVEPPPTAKPVRVNLRRVQSGLRGYW